MVLLTSNKPLEFEIKKEKKNASHSTTPKVKCLNQKLTKSEENLQSAHWEPQNSEKDQKNAQLKARLSVPWATRKSRTMLPLFCVSHWCSHKRLRRHQQPDSAYPGNRKQQHSTAADKPVPKLNTTTEALRARQQHGSEEGSRDPAGPSCSAVTFPLTRSKAMGEKDGLLVDDTVQIITI